jgi:hypothetical protein
MMGGKGLETLLKIRHFKDSSRGGEERRPHADESSCFLLRRTEKSSCGRQISG